MQYLRLRAAELAQEVEQDKAWLKRYEDRGAERLVREELKNRS